MPKQVPIPPPTKLTIHKSQYRELLEEQIAYAEANIVPLLSLPNLTQARDLYEPWKDRCIEVLKNSFNNHLNEYRIQFKETGPSGFFARNAHQQDADFRQNINAKVQKLKSFLGSLDLLRSDESANSSKLAAREADLREVFIVHGRDTQALLEVERFLRMLGLDPVILHQQATEGRTIIEKIEAYTDVGFAIVLYTACDVGSLAGDEVNLLPRARQNVVFEHGYLIGKIGRANVCALVKGAIERPNDISGVVYVDMSSTWEMQVAVELRQSGYDVDLNKLIPRRSGT